MLLSSCNCVWLLQEPRTLSAAVQFYCGRSHSKADAHSALGDADATLRVLVEQVSAGVCVCVGGGTTGLGAG